MHLKTGTIRLMHVLRCNFTFSLQFPLSPYPPAHHAELPLPETAHATLPVRKPSQARDIARVLDARNRSDGYLHNATVTITGALAIC